MLARQRTGKRDDGLRNASERRSVFEQTGAVSDSGLVCTWADQPYPPSAVPVREKPPTSWSTSRFTSRRDGETFESQQSRRAVVMT